MADCTPATVVSESICFDCDSITTKQLLGALVYLTASETGASTDPETLIQASKCFACDSITEKQLLAIIVYLTCSAT